MPSRHALSDSLDIIIEGSEDLIGASNAVVEAIEQQMIKVSRICVCFNISMLLFTKDEFI